MTKHFYRGFQKGLSEANENWVEITNGEIAHLFGTADEGGFLVPSETIFPKAGIKAWFLRLLHDQRGWEKRNFEEELRKFLDRGEVKK